jgi:hypothetical protein
MKNQTSQDDRDLRAWQLKYPRVHLEEACRNWKIDWNEQQSMKHIETLLNIWPFHLIEVYDQGNLKFWQTHLEKERLQSLGLKNLFPTSWPKPGHLPSVRSRWKRSLNALC